MVKGKEISEEIWSMLPDKVKKDMKELEGRFKESIEADVNSAIYDACMDISMSSNKRKSILHIEVPYHLYSKSEVERINNYVLNGGVIKDYHIFITPYMRDSYRIKIISQKNSLINKVGEFIKGINLKRLLMRKRYVISKEIVGVKYYYLGMNDCWTPIVHGAEVYDKRPLFEWIEEQGCKVEEY